MQFPLIYPSNHTGKFVLLIDSAVTDSQVFYDSVNADTFPIIYSTSSSKTDLLAVLDGRVIDRIGVVFATGGN